MEKKNLVIIGSGPAAWTAAIYSARAMLEPVLFQGVIKGGIPGGQLMSTTEVENFPGFPQAIQGPQLMKLLRTQAEKFHVFVINEDVEEIDLSKTPFIVKASSTLLQAESIIIATGAIAKRLDITGAKEGEFWQKGVSACATCDGALPLFRGKDLFVVGGGDTAMEEAIFLTKFAKNVYIVHRRDKLRASAYLSEKVKNHPKIKILYNRKMIKIEGDKFVKQVILQDVESKNTEKKEAGGVFFAIGHSPNSEFLKGQLELDPNGYIITKGKTTCTSIEGVFAAGDIQDPVYRQAVTAAASGCMAAIDVQKWLVEKGFIN